MNINSTVNREPATLQKDVFSKLNGQFRGSERLE